MRIASTGQPGAPPGGNRQEHISALETRLPWRCRHLLRIMHSEINATFVRLLLL